MAHDKTVAHNKDHAGKPIAPDAAETVQPGKKPPLKHHAKDAKPASDKHDAGSH